MSRNLNQAASKDTLAQWVTLALRRVLTESNIKNGFSASGIWPINSHAVDSQLAPSAVFEYELPDGEVGSGNFASSSRQGRTAGRQVRHRESPQRAQAEDEQEHSLVQDVREFSA
jgi:hypothetical protein